MGNTRQRNSNLATHVHDAGSSKLLWVLALLFLAGIGLIAVSHARLVHATLLGEIFRDLGIAFCISVTIAGIIEVSLSRHIYLRGVDAIMQRTVPEDVWDDFRQHVITQPMMRESYSLTMTMTQTGDGRYVSTTNIKYILISLQDQLHDCIALELDAHRNPPGTHHRYTHAKIGDRSFNSHTDLVEAKLLSDDGLTLKLPAHIAKHNETLPVEIEFKELINCPDSSEWWMARVTRDLTLTIIKLPESWCVDVKAFHPAQYKLVQTNEANEWKFTGIMLPGQGIAIRTRPRAVAETPAS